jgi:hypothetical protein
VGEKRRNTEEGEEVRRKEERGKRKGVQLFF